MEVSPLVPLVGCAIHFKAIFFTETVPKIKKPQKSVIDHGKMSGIKPKIVILIGIETRTEQIKETKSIATWSSKKMT